MNAIRRSPPRSFSASHPRRLRLEEIQQGIELSEYWGQDRPRTRADCGPIRPCPFVSCRYHLYLDVRPTTKAATIRVNFPDLEGPHEMEWTCALDEAESQNEGMTLEEIGRRLNVTRERARQIEFKVLGKLRPLLVLLEAWDDSVNRRVRIGPGRDDEHAMPF